MADVASLGIRIDSSQVKTATGDLKQLAGTAGLTGGQIGALESAAKRNNVTFTETVARYVATHVSLAKMTGGLTQATRAANDNAAAAAGLVSGLTRYGGGFSLVSLAMQAATAAATAYFAYIQSNAPTVEETFKEQNRLVGVIKDSYDNATQSLKYWFDQSKDVTRLQTLMQEIDLRKKLNEEVGKVISKSTTFGGIGDFIAGAKTVKADLVPFEDAIFKLQDGFKQGTPNVEAFRDEIAKIALLSPSLQKIGADLISNAGDASKFYASLQQIRAVVSVLDGKTPSEDDRRRLGLPEPPKASSAVRPFDSQVNSINKHIAAMKADADAVGATAGEHARLRAEAQLLEVAQRNGAVATDAQKAKIQELGQAASDAAMKLAKAQINDQIKFDRATIGLSQQDVQIAGQLRKIYPDVTTALGSTEAAQMRVNDQIREGRDVAQQFASTFVQGLLQGKSGMDALVASADQLASSLANDGVKDLFSGSFIEGGLKLGAALRVGTFTGDVKPKRSEQDNEPPAEEERKAA